MGHHYMGKASYRINRSQQEPTKTEISQQGKSNTSKKSTQSDLSQDVQSTWQVPNIDKSHLWNRQTTHRDRMDTQPNKKGGYGRSRNKFYTLPYETRAELKHERRKALNDAPMEKIPENEELNHKSRFMKFDKELTIDKNHIIGLHRQKDPRAKAQEYRRNIFSETEKGQSAFRTPCIGINPVAILPTMHRSTSESSFFTQNTMRRSNSYKNNLANLANEQNETSEKPTYAEKIELERSQSAPEISYSWESLSL